MSPTIIVNDESGIWDGDQLKLRFRLEPSSHDRMAFKTYLENGIAEAQTCRRRKYPGVSLPSLMIMSGVARGKNCGSSV